MLPLSVQAQSSILPTTIIAPAAPGGGWDQLARTMQRTLDIERIMTRVHVENIPGAAGTLGLARFVTARRGDANALLITGLVMVGGISQHGSPVTLEQTTPIARLVGEYEVIVVPSSSKYRTLGQLLADFRAAPASIAWGGGSAGGTDQILVDLIATARGVDPRQANYVAFSGGGEATAALLGAQVTVGVSGLGEFSALLSEGRLRALAVSSPSRVNGVDVPTLRELGVPVDLANWRGLVAPPGITPARRAALIRDVERMVRSATWRQELVRRGWENLWLPGDGFTRFLAAELGRVNSLVAARRGVRAAYSTAALSRLPLLLGVLLATLLVATAVRQHLAKSRARASGAAGSVAAKAPASPLAALSSTRVVAHTGVKNRVGVALIAFGMLLDVLLIYWVGFILAGATRFAVTAYAFGERRLMRAGLGGVAFAATVYLVFRLALDVPLPIGRMWGGVG